MNSVRQLAVGLILIATFSGCANVSPTQRATLARPDMQFDFDRAAGAITGHTYASKEGASGGKGVGGGGCGCT
ncbi:MAG: DUF4266 domain-containing protein [Aeromicrobium sp.]|nr:DUF4266 domain-containing protein [Burkholderiales bacterium]